MDEKELAELLERYRQGTCTESERRLVESLHLHAYGTDPVRIDFAERRRIWRKLAVNLQPTRTHAMARRLAIAATVLAVAALALWLGTATERPVQQAVADIPAGGNRAVLRLADGRIIDLDTAQSGIAVLGGRMVYADSTFLGSVASARDGEAYPDNEIVTPRGGMYRIALEDGTKVWINSGSAFKFPPRFARARREVILDGEAYFEVATDPSRPFVIKTAGQEIQVLGTAFNVSAYADNGSERTTLVEGGIVVSTPRQRFRLSPGEQAVIDNDGVSVGEVDTAPFVAWKSGYFAFNEEPLEHIMRDIGRWYDVDIHFEGVDKQLRFGGTVSRYANVSEVLRRLELTGQVRFKIEERGIVITP